MEADLRKKVQEIQNNYKGTTGVLLVDKVGLPIDSTGNLDKSQSGLISSIMKNAAKLEKLLSQSTPDSAAKEYNYYNQGQQPDITAKVYFSNETLLIRNK